MTAQPAAWLRQEREARGWSRADMARQLIKAAHATGDTSVPGTDSMIHNVYRWEHAGSGLSTRYRRHYCHAFGIPFRAFGSPGHDTPASPTQAPGTVVVTPAPPVPIVPAETTVVTWAPHPLPQPIAPPGSLAYGEKEWPHPGPAMIRREVLMAAHRGSEHAQDAEDHGIGDTTYEQLRADVTRLARDTDTGQPFTVFQDMARVRDRIYKLLERRLWPREQTDLYFLLGVLNALMGRQAYRLGYPDAAEELVRAGCAYAIAIDHRPLLGALREHHAHIAYRRGRLRDSRDLAASGLSYLPTGPMAADLHLWQARASARLGDTDLARQSVNAAHQAHAQDRSDDMLEIGGEFVCSPATYHYDTGRVLAHIPGAGREANQTIEHAVSMYAAGPRSGETHSFSTRARASIDLAMIRLQNGALDAAADALAPVLTLPPMQRIAELTGRLTRVRTELATPVFRGSSTAQDLDVRIEDFGRDTATAGLHTLTGGPA